MTVKLTAARVEAEDIDQALETIYERGWTDGLPVAIPTESRVAALLEHLGRDSQEVIGTIPPRGGIATIEKIAINAAMAGCKPEYLPVVLAAVEAMLEDPFNLHGVQATTHCVAPLVIVSGPVVKELGFNHGDGVFGGGSRANAAVGRAVRLVLWNIGGGKPGEVDRATIGHPGKYAYCIAEDPDNNPWEPLHVERGLAPEQSAVTVFGCEAPPSLLCGPGPASTILDTIAHSMATLGSNNTSIGGQTLVTLSPRAARALAREGWDRRSIKEFLQRHATLPLKVLRRGPRDTDDPTDADFGPRRRGMAKLPGHAHLWPQWIDESDEETPVPIIPNPQDIHLAVCGGWGATGTFCAVCPGWGYFGGHAATRPIPSPH